MIDRFFLVLFISMFGFTSVFAQYAIDLEGLCVNGKVDKSGFRVPGRDGFAWDFYNHPKPQYLPHGYNLGENYSITLWFNLSDGYGKSTLLSSFANRKFLLMIQGARTLSLVQRGRPNLQIEYKLQVGRWYHLAITVTRTQICMYLDGILIGTKISEKTDDEIPRNDLRVIGAYNNKRVSDHAFKGLIDNPVLYNNRALSSNEIFSDYTNATRTIKITPMPQQVHLKQSKNECSLSKGICVKLNTQLLKRDDIAFMWLKKSLNNNLEFELKESRKILSIWDYNSASCPEYLKKGLDGVFPREGYVLSLNSEVVDLAAATPRGLFYGLVTLGEMLKIKKEWPELTIFDYPRFPFRCAMYVNDGQPPILLNDNLTEYVTAMARYKIRYFMVRSADWIDLDSPKTKKAILKLDEFLKKHHMELIPYLQTYGHAKPALWKNIKTGHTKTIANEEYIVQKSSTVLKHKNVIRSLRTPIIIKSENRAVLEENKDYKIIDGTLRTTWDWPKGKRCRAPWAKPYICEDNEPFSIEWLTQKNGVKVFVTYDIAGNTEGTCPFQKEYHDLLSDSFKRIGETIKPKMINLGMDEIWYPKGKGRCCSHCKLTNGQLIVYEIQSTFLALHAVAPKVRMMIFNDMLDPNQTTSWKGTEDLSWLKQGKMPREIIQIPWNYSGRSSIKIASAEMLKWALKYSDSTIGASGHRIANILQWAYSSLPYSYSGKVPGVLFTRWAANPKTAASMGYQVYSQSMWSPNHFMIPNMLEVHWTLLNMGVTTESRTSDLEALIQSLKSQDTSKVMIAQLNAVLDKAEYEMVQLETRTHFKQLDKIVKSMIQSRKIVKAFR